MKGKTLQFENYSLGAKAKAFTELLKIRLSFLVSFSSAIGYVLALKGMIIWTDLIIFFLGGVLISGASVTINQILERDYDALMKRTRNRPIPTGRINIREAVFFASIILILGVSLMTLVANPLAIIIALASFLIYSFIYTPLKRVGPIAVFIGAIPGALPPLIGWTAATGVISYEALIIFGIQFIWQFPHFWAIAWISDEDYKKAGFQLLPFRGGKNINTAIQIMIYTLFLIPLGLLPAKFGMTGINSAFIATVCGVLFVAQTFNLIRECLPGRMIGNGDKIKSARMVLYGSFLYLPIVQIAYVLDKI